MTDLERARRVTDVLRESQNDPGKAAIPILLANIVVLLECILAERK